MEYYIKHRVRVFGPIESTEDDLALIAEEPLSIRVQGQPYSVVMRTPGDELAHTAGFCLGEGIADSLDDIGNLAFCDGDDTNVVTVTLKEPSKKKISDVLARRGYISQTSCGICGKEIVEDLKQELTPVNKDLKLMAGDAVKLIDGLGDFQPLRDKTRAAHGAAIFSKEILRLSVAEDVGRHNALDKAIGKLFLEKKLELAHILVLSSRISYELVQKAARARIPVILAVSRPTALAASLALELNMTIACLSKGGGLIVFSGHDRIDANLTE